MINWEEQWRLFAPGFKDGYLPLGTLRLLPGPGFGDLSHETTQLMVEYLPQVVADCVIDIGCGSGILSLVAKALGAKKVIALDICPEAIVHAKKNAKHNNLHIQFTLPKEKHRAPFFMNMIYSEQEQAWQSQAALHTFKGDLVISGLLKKHKKHAIDYWKDYGWNYYTMKTKGEWILIHFKKE